MNTSYAFQLGMDILQRRELYFFDLFAGAGGTTLGLERAGFTSLGFIENDPYSVKTHVLNFGEPILNFSDTHRNDIRQVPPMAVKRKLNKIGIGSLDLLVATPPCQGFSYVGRGKLNSLSKSRRDFRNDPRNKLYSNVLKYISTLKPKAILFENVPGMLNVRGRNVIEQVCLDIEELGYNVKCSLLNASLYGVPQSRERAIILATRSDLPGRPEFPLVQCDTEKVGGHSKIAERFGFSWEREDFFVPYSALRKKKNLRPAVSVESALGDLPAFTQHLAAIKSGKKYRALRELFGATKYPNKRPSEYGVEMRTWPGFTSNEVSDHFCRWTPRDFRLFRKLKHGQKYPDALKHGISMWKAAMKRTGKRISRALYVPPYRVDNFKERWRKLIPSKLSWTLTAHLGKDSYTHIHYDSSQARTISIREAARLQSFPDGFKFYGNMGEVLKQIGNAVPPILAFHLGLAIKKQLELSPNSSFTMNRLKVRDEHNLNP